MRQVAAARPDPAPSRLTYRLERLMLTPLFRFTLRVGLPCALSAGLGWAWLSVPENRAALSDMVAAVRLEIQSHPEFRVDLMAIEGASEGTAQDIREILPVDMPVSSFDLDLPGMKEVITGLDAVKRADLRIDEHVLRIAITERVPAVLWRRSGGLELLDATGHQVAPALARAAHPDLPVIAGEGAERAVDEALALFAAAGPLTARLRGFERMGARRWDVVLDRGQRILLPETQPVQALERVLAMDAAVDMLARDLITVDLRLPHRPTLRMSQAAVEEFRRFKAIEVGGEEQE